MKLVSIKIENYRSVKNVVIPIHVLDDETATYGLIGVNEAGKSTILKAIAMSDGLITPTLKDFREGRPEISISLRYDDCPFFEVPEQLSILDGVTTQSAAGFSASSLIVRNSFRHVSFEKKSTYFAVNDLDEEVEIQGKFDLPGPVHTTIFWTSEERYLISKPVDLARFAADPDGTSIPLKNCFSLAGITDIQSRISVLAGDSTEVEQLSTELGAKVTSHITAVWPGHPIQITFQIGDGHINFHIRDDGATGKAKTADQRSDGFKQFVSFLLTISAQNKNEELRNSILLLDEPETHLHPQAQEYLLIELKRISGNKRNNITLFATHSNFMIDKKNINRNFRVSKGLDGTEVKQLSNINSSYSGVNFEVFGIPTSDYHSELYAKLHAAYQAEEEGDKDRTEVRSFDKAYFSDRLSQPLRYPWKKSPNQITLSSYIRNCINHPDNGDKYSDEQLLESIQLMRKSLCQSACQG